MSKGGSRRGAGRPVHKLKAENASTLDVKYLSKNSYLDDGNWKRLYWKQYGETRLEGLVKAFASHITVDVGLSSHRIDMTQTPCHLGGNRDWFLCPRCGKRMGVLYFRRGYFACRHCQKIAYQSQSGDSKDRIVWKYHTLHDKVCNWKLKRSARFQRLFNKYLEVANAYETILEAAFLRISRADDYRANT